MGTKPVFNNIHYLYNHLGGHDVESIVLWLVGVNDTVGRPMSTVVAGRGFLFHECDSFLQGANKRAVLSRS